MAAYKPGDRVIVTRPQQPTHHQGGETDATQHAEPVRVQERGNGNH